MAKKRFRDFLRVLLLCSLATLCVIVLWKHVWIQQTPTSNSAPDSWPSRLGVPDPDSGTKYYPGTKGRLAVVPREREAARPEELFSTPENQSWICYLQSEKRWLMPAECRQYLEDASATSEENTRTKQGLTTTTDGENRTIPDNVTHWRRLGMSREEILAYLDLVDVFTTSLSRANLNYFLYSGSLLGSWRHHGIVPWDDDVDFAVSFHESHNVSQVLKSIGPGYHLYEGQESRWKFFSDQSYPISGQPWRWPFLDISFLSRNKNLLQDYDLKRYPLFEFIVSDVFPLVKRPFMGRMLPVPHNTEAVLRKTYRLQECRIGAYDHRVEDTYPDAWSINCSDLLKLYPFVHRVNVPGKTGCNETLVKDGTVVGWLFQPHFQC